MTSILEPESSWHEAMMKKILRRAATTNASFCHLIPAGLSFDSWKVVKNYYLGVSVMSHEVRDRANQINVFISKSRKEVNLSTQLWATIHSLAGIGWVLCKR
jgi:DNA-binding response OmpR family regulator